MQDSCGMYDVLCLFECIRYKCLCDVPIEFLDMRIDALQKCLTSISNPHYESASFHKINQNTQE